MVKYEDLSIARMRALVAGSHGSGWRLTQLYNEAKYEGRLSSFSKLISRMAEDGLFYKNRGYIFISDYGDELAKRIVEDPREHHWIMDLIEY